MIFNSAGRLSSDNSPALSIYYAAESSSVCSMSVVPSGNWDILSSSEISTLTIESLSTAISVSVYCTVIPFSEAYCSEAEPLSTTRTRIVRSQPLNTSIDSRAVIVSGSSDLMVIISNSSTDLGSTTFASFLQSENAPSPIFSSLSGNSTEVSSLQPEKAYSSITVS